MLDYTYLRYIAVLYKNERLIIDLETLNPVEYTNDIDVENNDLPEVEIKKIQETYKEIKLSEIYENKNGLKSAIFNRFVKIGKTLSRDIMIKSTDCVVNLTLSVDKDNDDRNGFELKINGTRELNQINYKGINIIKSDEWEIANLFEF